MAALTGSFLPLLQLVRPQRTIFLKATSKVSRPDGASPLKRMKTCHSQLWSIGLRMHRSTSSTSTTKVMMAKTLQCRATKSKLNAGHPNLLGKFRTHKAAVWNPWWYKVVSRPIRNPWWCKEASQPIKRLFLTCPKSSKSGQLRRVKTKFTLRENSIKISRTSNLN